MVAVAETESSALLSCRNLDNFSFVASSSYFSPGTNHGGHIGPSWSDIKELHWWDDIEN